MLVSIVVKGVVLLETFDGKSKRFSISLHPCLGKVFVEWTMFLDTFLHTLVDIGEVVEGVHPAFVARITIPHPPSAQPTF